LQDEKSSPPKARFPLWHVIQLCARGGAWWLSGRGFATCRPWAAPAWTLWQSLQFNFWRGVCLAWLKLTL
jgi:hypothetical protein